MYISALRVWLFRGRFPVAPSSYTNGYIIVCYNFQACCNSCYRDITPRSEFSDHPSYMGKSFRMKKFFFSKLSLFLRDLFVTN